MNNGMNLHNIVRSAITTVVPDIAIILNVFASVTIDNAGQVTTTYTTISNLMAQVQLQNSQKMIHKDYYQQNKIYKKFYLPSYSLTGLNRNLSTAGDYIICQNLYYKIVEVDENYQVGWVGVVGCESASNIESSPSTTGSMLIMFQAIIALMIANFSADYPQSTIAPFIGYPLFQGYQNNYMIPQNGQYVVITAMPEKNQILNPTSLWNLNTDTQDYYTLFSSGFQADFYGTNAELNAGRFQLLLQSDYGNNFFLDNNYVCSVHEVKDVINLTDIVGRDMYLPRFVVRYSLFNNPIITTPLSTFDGVTNNIRLADVQT